MLTYQPRHSRRPSRQVWRRGLAATTATVTAIGLAVATPAIPAGASPANEPAEAHAAVLAAAAGTRQVAGAAYSQASSETNPGPNRSGVDPSLFRNTIAIAGVQVPLSDFITFGQAGAVYSQSTATSPWNTHAISGTLSSDGSISLDRADGGFTPVTIDLLSLFKAAGVSGLTNQLVSQAEIRLGIGGAEVETHNGRFLDPDEVGGVGRYRVAQADLVAASPFIKQAAARLYDGFGVLDQTAEDRVNQMLDMSAIGSQFPGGTTVKATVTSSMQEKVVAAILARPITTKNKILTVDFSTGTATIHLDQVLAGQHTVDGPVFPGQVVRPGDPTGLNSQAPNTELIDDELYPMVAESVHDLMDEVWTVAMGVIDNSVSSINVSFTATRDGATASWSVDLDGDPVGAPSCTPAGATCDQLVAGINAARTVINSSVVPARDLLLSDAGEQLFRLAIDDIKTAALTSPARNALDPFLQLVAQVFSVQLNHQRVGLCNRPGGGTAVDAVEVSAVSVSVLRHVATINLGIAGTRTAACSATAEASIVDTHYFSRNVAGAGYSWAEPGVNPGLNQGGAAVQVLGEQQINLGGVQIPLSDFIDFGQAGVLESESTAITPANAKAVAGAAGSDGAVTLDRTNGDFAPATVDLLALFRKAGITGASNLVDTANLRLGIGGAEVEAINGVIQDPDGVGGPGRYRVAQADLEFGSPSVKEAAARLYDALGVLDDTAETQLNKLLGLTKLTAALPGGTSVTARVNSDTRDRVFGAILAKPITTKNKIVTVDFSKGTMTIHLDQVLAGQHTVDGPVFPGQVVRPGDPTGLNSQKPNTELVDDEIYPMIAESVHDLMDEVWTIAMGVVENSLDSITVDFTATTSGLPGNSATAKWTVNLGGAGVSPVSCTSQGALGGLLCATLVTAIGVVTPLVNTVLVPAREFVIGDAGQQVFRLAVDDLKTAAITIPVRQAAEPFLEFLAKVVSVQVNHQRTGTVTSTDGSTQLRSLRVSAVSIGLLRQSDVARIDFGNASVHLSGN